VSAEEVSGVVEEYASVARQAVDVAKQAVEAAKLWRRKYRALRRRALERVRDAVAELESADGSDPHVRAALELLYDLERMLGVVGE
jgi:hypothetical protein